MKLIHVITTSDSLGFLGQQLRFLGQHGIETRLVCSPARTLTSFASSEGVSVDCIEMTRTMSPARDLVALIKLIALFLRERPDVVHTHTPKACLLAGIAGWMTRVPFRLCQIHGFPHSTGSGISRHVLWWSARIPAMLSHKVLCVSRSVAEMAMQEGISSQTAVLNHGSSNGVDAYGRFNPGRLSRNAGRSEMALDADALVIGFAGRLVRDKGICELYTAWQEIRTEFPTAILVIAGPKETRDSVPVDVMQSLAADDRVRLLGAWNNMPMFYSAIDFLVLPSFREGLPTVVLEAAAMKVPTIASSCVGCVDAVVDGVTGVLVRTGDPAALADAMRQYLSNADLRKEHGQSARIRVLRDFRPEDVWIATLNEYRNAQTQIRAFGRSRAGIRVRDFVISSLVLFLLLPIIAVLVLLVRMILGTPVLFRQRRPGLNGRLFTMYKFRTMRDAYDEDGNPLPDDERLTRFGRFLRSSSLDELPELWNVLKGDMSLVGPRPLLPEYLLRYTDLQRRRHEVKPGITGWAQINGRNGLSWEEKFNLDVWYVNNQSLVLDLKILWRTLLTVVRRDGITENGHVSMSKFMGSV